MSFQKAVRILQNHIGSFYTLELVNSVLFSSATCHSSLYQDIIRKMDMKEETYNNHDSEFKYDIVNAIKRGVNI
ncbi:MAG: hypothetical protein WKF36_07145 [Candidatus Nitrosocosmicus sp.]